MEIILHNLVYVIHAGLLYEHDCNSWVEFKGCNNQVSLNNVNVIVVLFERS